MTCAEAAALVSAGEAAVATTCVATTPLEEELLGSWESDCLPSESFFDEEPAEDGEAALIPESWVTDALAEAFAGACGAFVDAAKLFPAIDIVFKFVADGVAETLLEIPCPGTGAGAAEAAGCMPCGAS